MHESVQLQICDHCMLLDFPPVLVTHHEQVRLLLDQIASALKSKANMTYN